MAEEAEAPPMTIAQRMAALKLAQVGKIPGQPPPAYNQSTNGNAQPVTAAPRPRPPPPPRPQLPARPDRPQSANVPPVQDQPFSGRQIGNQPEREPPSAPHVNGVVRPSLPARTSTQSSQAVPSPALPPRRQAVTPSPALPPRRPSEAPSQTSYGRGRRDSTDSMSSIATTRSSISAISNATSLTSQGDRRVKAPDYDPSSLPPLPPKRTAEEREAHDRKYAGLKPPRRTKSTPKVEPIGKESTPPPTPARQYVPPPALPIRQQGFTQDTPKAIEPAARPVRAESPPPSSRQEPAPPPRPRQSALSWGMNKATEVAPTLPGARPDSALGNGVPPPIPASSKPDLAALQASKPKFNASNGANGVNGAGPRPPPGNSKPIEITSPDHLTQIINSHQFVVVDFYADYCNPCKQISPTYDQLCAKYFRPNQIAFTKVNRPAREDCYSIYGVNAMPTLLYFKNGTEIDRMVGASPEWLEMKVTDHIEDLGVENMPAPTAAPVLPGAANCLHCRDFSGPDNHAARFPRQSIPSADVGWLAQQLTAPFPSLTDKARSIFTWLHHNVAYDTVAFFGNNVKPSTPQGTIQSGLAVCEGYAGLFAALGIKAGLEVVVCNGASKGFGHSQIAPGDPIPPYKSDHAWNAVKLDDGHWKLIDPCWGAGHLGDNRAYKQSFSPERFTQSNDEFGLDHFPSESHWQYRNDGRTLTWEEFTLGNKSGTGAFVFNGFVAEEGLLKTTFKPTDSKIRIAQQGPSVRFSFQKICPHWDPIRHGKGPYYLYMLHLDSLQDTPKNYIPFETNGDVWWCDIPTGDLGRPGQSAQIYTVTTFDNKDGRGLTIDQYRRKKGRVGMSFGGVAKWEIA